MQVYPTFVVVFLMEKRTRKGDSFRLEMFVTEPVYYIMKIISA